MGEERAPSGDRSAVFELLTAARMSSYIRSAPSRSAALELYEWNLRASSSVMELASMVEVITRNALDRRLDEWAERRNCPDRWFDAVPLDEYGRRDLAKARQRAERAGSHEEVHGRVVAELSFGFWRYLVESRYHTSLWVPDLHRAFPLGPADLRRRRTEVRRRMQQLHFVRNRAAHHEPIHERDLRRDHDYAIELLGWISPAAAGWAADTTSLRAVLATRPSP